MNENTTAGSLFFALLSIAALMKFDSLLGTEGIGFAFSLIFAIVSAFFLKKSIMQEAITQEENHQRIEIQFQQLRHKIGGDTGSSEETIRAVDNCADRLETELQVIRDTLAALEPLAQIAETNSEIKSTLTDLSVNVQDSQEILKKLKDNTESENKLSTLIVEKLTAFDEKMQSIDESAKKLNELTEAGQNTSQTGVKLLTAVGQMLKNPPFAKDITQLSKSMEELNEKIAKLEMLDKLDSLDKLELLDKLKLLDKLNSLEEIKSTMNNADEKLINLQTMNDTFNESGKLFTTNIDNLCTVNKNITSEVKHTTENVYALTNEVEKTSESITTAIKSMQEDITKLTTKIDAYNGLMKTALEQYSTLSEQDVKVLERIAEKIQ